ncbi:mannose-binding lectin [Dendrothele bispora CBS 962.96]|uniref:Mannose-binding lectin n=1 Tax=Dendrothele bispora (strain CBS 962.96) TaxID=1314807 RepID=A0A4S8LNH2_DENBC|nr:mannose-binding lectin [Dendrothele bispora CBS 962.96]
MFQRFINPASSFAQNNSGILLRRKQNRPPLHSDNDHMFDEMQHVANGTTGSANENEAAKHFSPIWIGQHTGGRGGSAFDGTHSISGATLQEIRVWSGEYVNAIELKYNFRGNTFTTGRYGGQGGILNTFELAAGEFVVKIEGHAGWYIDHLRFTTNTGRQSKRFGGRRGKPFLWSPPQDIGAVGLGWFSGASGDYVDSLTPYFISYSTDYNVPSMFVCLSMLVLVLTHGLKIEGHQKIMNIKTAWIGQSAGTDTGPGIPFDGSHSVVGARLQEICLWTKDSITAIQLIYTVHGQTFTTGRHGSGHIGTLKTFTLGLGEVIVKIDGRSSSCINQLCFTTNTGRRSQIYGGSGGMPFVWLCPVSFDTAGLGWFTGKIRNSLIDSLAPYFIANDSTPDVEDRISHSDGDNVVNNTIPIWVNQYAGGEGGVAFDCRHSITGAKLQEIWLWESDCIHAIQLLYSLHGGVFTTGYYGNVNKGIRQTFTLTQEEFIVRVDGYASWHINQLCFTTNTGRKSKNFGGKTGKPFIWSSNNNFTGLGWFSGASSDMIDSLTPYFIPYTSVQSSRNVNSGSTESIMNKVRIAWVGECVGGDGGTVFDGAHSISGARLQGIHMWISNVLGSIQLTYTIQGQTFTTGCYGSHRNDLKGYDQNDERDRGVPQTFLLAPGESIVKIEGFAGKYINRLQFTTNTGRESPSYGEEYNEEYVEEYGERYSEEYGERYSEEYGEEYANHFIWTPPKDVGPVSFVINQLPR